MSFFLATLGQLIIIELCVLLIWLKVMFGTIRDRDTSLDHKRMLITSIGLALNSIAIVGIMIFRVIEYAINFWPFVSGLVGFYVILGIGNIMFIIAAAIGGSTRTLKVFMILSLIWILFCISFNYVADLNQLRIAQELIHD